VAGLLIVGLVLLGVSVAAKRRNGPAAKDATGRRTRATVA